MNQDLTEVPFDVGVSLLKTHIMSNAIREGKTLVEAKALAESVTPEEVQKALAKLASMKFKKETTVC